LHDGHRLGHQTRALLLKDARRFRNSLRHNRLRLLHRYHPWWKCVSGTAVHKKSRRGQTRLALDHVGLPFDEPPGLAGLLFT